MKSKLTLGIGIATILLAAIYVGIYIGRVSSGNVVNSNSVTENTNTVPEESQKIPPLDLNTATLEELCKVPGITYPIANQILQYREKYGYFVDVDELLEIEEISASLFQQILPYITVSDPDRP